MPILHKLKTHPIPFGAMRQCIKNFDVRKDDRCFRVGEELLLEEFIPAGYFEDHEPERGYTGEILHRRIDYILKGGQYGIEKGFVVLGVSKI